MNRVNVTNQYTPKQRQEQRNLRNHIQKCRVQLESLYNELSIRNAHKPTKSIEASAIQIEIATAHLALAKFDRTPDGETWINKCEARCNKAFRDYQKAIRWALVEVALTPIVLPLRHNIGNFKRYTLKTNTYYEVFPK